MSAKCQSTVVVTPQGQVLNHCSKMAIESRTTWRWGVAGEPAIVKFTVGLCRPCARAWDENKADAEAEGRMS